MAARGKDLEQNGPRSAVCYFQIELLVKPSPIS